MTSDIVERTVHDEAERPVVPASGVIRGEVVWMFAYDVAFEIRKDAAGEALSAKSEYRKAGRYRRAPESVRLYSPLMVELPERELPGYGGARQVRPCAKIFSVGAISVSLRLPFEVRSIDDLIPLRTMVDWEGEGPATLALEIAQDIEEQIRPALVRPEAKWDRREDYAAFCITEADGLAGGTVAWLEARRPQAAALLLGEGPPDVLSVQQIEEALRLRYAFTKADLAIVDWDCMLVVDTETDYEELLYVAEAANVQLVELRVHDDMLEAAVDGAYADLDRYYARPALFRKPARLAHSLREQRMDLAKTADQIFNVSKYLGDWYLARIYEGLATRFHLAEWQDQLESKLKTVDSLYEIIAKETTDRNMLVLEFLIVIMFVLDLIIIVLQIFLQTE